MDIKQKARYLSGQAIKNGKIVRGICEVCGEFGEGHHPDYSKPLLLRWLCKPHHLRYHGQFRLMQRSFPDKDWKSLSVSISFGEQFAVITPDKTEIYNSLKESVERIKELNEAVLLYDLAIPRQREQFSCGRCNYQWTPRHEHIPKSCPECKSYRWNLPAYEPA